MVTAGKVEYAPADGEIVGGVVGTGDIVGDCVFPVIVYFPDTPVHD